MKKLLINIIIVFVGIYALPLKAQQVGRNSLYQLNMYDINPAMIGLNPGMVLNSNTRLSWVGFAGAPLNHKTSINGALNKSVSLALKLDYASLGAQRTSNVLGTFGYHLKLKEDMNVRFGLSAGFIMNQINFSMLYAEDYDEGTLFTQNQSSKGFDANIGANYNWKNFNVGLAIDHILVPQLKYHDDFLQRDLAYVFRLNFIAYSSYTFKVKEDLEITPMVVARSAEGLPIYPEVNTMVKYKDFNAGLGYTHQTSAQVYAAYSFSNFQFGYSYEHSINNLMNFYPSTHEVHLSYRFIKGKSGVSHDNKLQEKQLRIHQQEIDLLKQEVKQNRKELDSTNKRIQALEEELKIYKSDIENNLEEYKKLKENHIVYIDSNKITSSSKKEEVRVGPFHVIVGALSTLEKAKKFQKMLVRNTKMQTTIFLNDEKDWYLVSYFSSDIEEEAREALKVLKTKGFDKYFTGIPWLYW